MSPRAALSILLCLAVTAANPIVCPNLGSAAGYAVVTYSGVTSNGLAIIKGNLAVYPIGSVTGFSAGAIAGHSQLATAAAGQAQADALLAYNYCKGVPYTVDMSGMDLSGKTLTPGVYKFSSTAGILAGGILTLNGPGIYIFQVGSKMAAGANTNIVVKNGASAGCIYWQVGSSVTLGAGSTFLGNILVSKSVTFGADVTYGGSIYAQTGDVTLLDDVITQPASCNVC